MCADAGPAAALRLRTLIVAVFLALPAPTLFAAPPPPPSKPPLSAQPAPPSPPAAALPSYPDISSQFDAVTMLNTTAQNFTGTLKRHGRKIFLDEKSNADDPVSYNEYFVYDLDHNKLFRFLRDEQVYFETTLSLDQRVEAIRKGWVPAEGAFVFNQVKVMLSSTDTPLRPDIVDHRPVELNLREVTAEIPAIGSAPARTVKYYSFVWIDPALKLPVKISYAVNSIHQIVEYHQIKEESLDPALFEIPKGYVNLTPY
jgi:hypothetical protein